MIMELSIKEWNVNFGGDKYAEICPFANKYIEGTDIIIFTEVIDNDSIKKMMKKLNCEYIKYTSENRKNEWYNQVIILLKKELHDSLKIRYVDIDEKKWRKDDLPDICHIEINLGGKVANVIGTRVRIHNGEDGDYKNRCKQFEKLVSYIKKLEKVIVLGDFNNGMIKADSDIDYDDVKEKYELRWNNEKNPLRFYNFHKMKKILGNAYKFDEITGEDSSWGISLYDDNFSYGRIKNDQIISKNINLKSTSYNWDFIRDNKLTYECMLYNNLYKKGNKINHGYPDHAILNAIIEL